MNRAAISVLIKCILFICLYIIVKSGKAQCNTGFNLDPNLTSFCVSQDSVNLTAWDTTNTGGCVIAPGFVLYVDLDNDSQTDDNITFYYGGQYYVEFDGTNDPSFENNSTYKLTGSYFNPNKSLSFEFCDDNFNGEFNYYIYDRATKQTVNTGTILGSAGCTSININIKGIAIFSGPGVKNNFDGTGVFYPKQAGPGTHTITYYWNNQAGYTGTITKTITVPGSPVLTVNNPNIIKGCSTIITASGAETYLWNTGVNTNQITVSPQVTTQYIVTGTNSSGCMSTDTAVVTVSNNNSLKVSNISICKGDSATLTVDGAEKYIWSNGMTTSSITVKPINTTTYTVTGTFSECASIFGQSIVYVNPEPSILTQPESQVKCSASNASFDVAATGSNLSYQWQENGVNISEGSIYQGVNSANLYISNINNLNGNNYICIVTNNCPTSVSSLPAILTVTNSTSYQWQEDGKNLTEGGLYSGTTTENLSISDDTGLNGKQYRCIIGGCCSNDIFSEQALLTVNDIPSITSISGNKNKCPGDSAIFKISAIGDSLKYQWYENTIAISGATNNDYIIEDINSENQGDYFCVIDNSCGYLTSSLITITLNSQLSAFDVTGGGSYCSGDSGISVGLSNTQIGINYQLQLNSLNTGLPITGSGTAITFGKQPNAGTYTIVATSSGCLTEMNSYALITINSLPTIYNVTGGGSYCSENAGVPVNLSNSEVSVDYQLFNNGIIEGTPVWGTGTSITFGDQNSAGTYTVIGINASSCSSNMSGSAEVNIINPISILVQPLNISGCSGLDANISITASGSAPLSYQWYKNSNYLPAATNSQFTIVNSLSTDSGTYTCVASNICRTTTSNSAVISINTLPTISTEPAAISQCTGGNASFSITAIGTNPFSYQWMKNEAKMTGETDTVLPINNITATDGATYSCIISNICGAVTSNTANLTISSSPVITFVTPPKAKCSRDSVLFKVITTGTVPTYQWEKNGSSIKGATNSDYILSVLSQANDGTYTCLLSSECGDSTANSTLVVNVPPFISDTIHNQSICEGSSVTFNIDPTGTNLSFQWMQNGNGIPGATTSIFTINSLNEADGGAYSCITRNNCGSKNLNSFLLSIDQIPSLNISPITIPKNPGDSVSFSLSPSGTSPFSYQWLLNNDIIQGASSFTFNKKSIECADAGVYSSVISNTCGSSTALVFSLIINNCNNEDTISGKVIYDNAAETPITQTIVYLENSENEKLDSTTTDSLGVYSFYHVSNGSYNLVCGQTGMKWGGANPIDALLVNRYYVSLISTFGGDNALRSRAGKVNGGNIINPIDALLINRRYVRLINNFSINDWLYDPTIVKVNGESVNQNINANCAGDVNASYPH